MRKDFNVYSPYQINIINKRCEKITILTQEIKILILNF